MIEALVFNFDLHEPAIVNRFVEPNEEDLQLKLNFA